MEADIYPKNRTELADLISGCIGEYSSFHNTFKYYADGVSPDTAQLPKGWESRLIRFSNENTQGSEACCLDPHDLAYAKLAAGREKDLQFIQELIRHHLIKPKVVFTFIEQTEDLEIKKKMKERLERLTKKPRS